MVYLLDGTIELFQDINYDSYCVSTEKTNSISIIKITSLEENTFKFIIEDIPTHNTIPIITKIMISQRHYTIAEKISKNFPPLLPYINPNIVLL